MALGEMGIGLLVLTLSPWFFFFHSSTSLVA